MFTPDVNTESIRAPASLTTSTNVVNVSFLLTKTADKFHLQRDKFTKAQFEKIVYAKFRG